MSSWNRPLRSRSSPDGTYLHGLSLVRPVASGSCVAERHLLQFERNEYCAGRTGSSHAHAAADGRRGDTVLARTPHTATRRRMVACTSYCARAGLFVSSLATCSDIHPRRGCGHSCGKLSRDCAQSARPARRSGCWRWLRHPARGFRGNGRSRRSPHTLGRRNGNISTRRPIGQSTDGTPR